jgi:hypothetical protein
MKGGYYSRPSMPRWQRTTLASCVALVATMLAYVGVDYAKLPRIHHFQLERELRVGVFQGLPSGYPGLWTWALVAGLVAGAASWGLLGLRKSAASERTLGLWVAWALTAVLLALGYYTWNNWP